MAGVLYLTDEDVANINDSANNQSTLARGSWAQYQDLWTGYANTAKHYYKLLHSSTIAMHGMADIEKKKKPYLDRCRLRPVPQGSGIPSINSMNVLPECLRNHFCGGLEQSPIQYNKVPSSFTNLH